MLNLGKIYTNGKLQNHRTLLKIILNPFLRIIGFNIVSIFDNDTFIKYKLLSCPKKFDFKSSWIYILQPNQYKEK